MIEWVVSHQALIREVINGLCMVLFLTLTLMVMVFMWDAFADNFIERREKRIPHSTSWTTTPGVPTACALWWVFAAESYRTGAIWVLYNIGKALHRSPYPTSSNDGVGVFGEAGFGSTFGYLVAGVMLIGGLQRSIYIFTPPEWKRKVWFYATAGGVVFCLLPSIADMIKEFYNGF